MSRIPLFRLLAYLRPYRKEYVLGATYSLLNVAFDTAPEILIGVAVDTVVRQQDSWLSQLGVSSLMHQLVVLGVLTLCIWGFESLFQFLYSLKWRNLAQTAQHHLRLDAFAHVQSFDMETFDNQSTGNLLSILNDDVNQLERFLESGVAQILQVFASTLFVGIVFFVAAPSVALFAFLPIPLILFGSFYFQHKLAPLFLTVREKAGDIGRQLSNNITGIITIKSFTAEKFALKQVEKASTAYREANRKAIKWSAMVVPVIRMAILIGFVATLVYGGYLTIEGQLSVGIYSMLVFLTQRLLWPLTRLAEVTVNYQRAMASATRVFDLLETPISIPSEGSPLSSVKGALTLNSVAFAYQKGHPILRPLNLSIAPNETVAFVGTTGSGKTTLMKLLMRFYVPSEGSIHIDGKDIATVSLKDLRKHIGIVTQDVFLFDGTIAENIAYGMPEATMEQIVQAAKTAEAHAFIVHFPNGYQTIVGERGQKLSGGQRQRVALARAILRDPPILILDEATSAVDNETESAIQHSLEKIFGSRTTIMIAHRLSTVRSAQRIFVMEEGSIVEEGTHESLLKQEGIYSSLWSHQVRISTRSNK